MKKLLVYCLHNRHSARRKMDNTLWRLDSKKIYIHTLIFYIFLLHKIKWWKPVQNFTLVSKNILHHLTVKLIANKMSLNQMQYNFYNILNCESVIICLCNINCTLRYVTPPALHFPSKYLSWINKTNTFLRFLKLNFFLLTNIFNMIILFRIHNN